MKVNPRSKVRTSLILVSCSSDWTRKTAVSPATEQSQVTVAVPSSAVVTEDVSQNSAVQLPSCQT